MLNRKWETRLRELENKSKKRIFMAFPGFLEWIITEVFSIIVFICDLPELQAGECEWVIWVICIGITIIFVYTIWIISVC